ncbi:shikimate kinase [Desulfofustis glycolicus]|uniref:Shikimate kinase n=1 Tax=Desulfofustis glycolicus DSM 9705 TaxID=1121409 RepID=A0A1M5YA06_9BACT|nr:shikimate kinase [Desulfofustis glycolicus]MCB2218382.1 shikimate kinase [Desulfobulbaceae bacterium]SHI08343.1 shikimate kinase [Desulfofustis glycolicus DSM 9705]
MDDNRNLVLIGMPGSGKSTVGVILAKRLARPYLDSDILIQLVEGRTLQEIVDQDGYLVLREIEQRVLLDITCDHHVIATGGSAPYSALAMEHLKKNGVIVYLTASLQTLNQRVHDYETRGLAKHPDQSFLDLFRERSELYSSYADITIDSNGRDQDQVCDDIVADLQKMIASSRHGQ